MASLEFHNIKDEEANAMRRNHHNRRKLQIMLCLFNLGAAALFVFLRSSWFSIAVHIFSHLCSKFALPFNSTFCIILLGNVIILFAYALSDLNDDGEIGGQSDIYDESRNISESCLEIFPNDGSPSTVNETEERSPIVTANSSGDYSPEEEITRSELVEPPVLNNTVTAVTETRTMTRCTTVSTTTNGEKVSERKCDRRVQSESSEQELTTKVGRKLGRRLCFLEELTKEEFNRTVGDFIAKHKRKQMEEHKKSYKTEYLALTR